MEVAIHTEVTVEPGGEMRRRVLIEYSNRDECELRTTAAADDTKKPALSIFTEAGGAQLAEVPAETQLSAQSIKDGKCIAHERVRAVRAGERVSDATILRRGATAGASNTAAVRVDNYIIFRKYTYLEIIQDSATRESMGAAAAKIATNISEIVKKALRDSLAQQYDLSELESWLQSDFRRTLAPALVRILDEDPERPSGLEAIVDAMLQEGIHVNSDRILQFLNGTNRNPGSEEEILRDLDQGVRTRIASLLKRPGSTPANPGAPVKAGEFENLFHTETFKANLEKAFREVTGGGAGLDSLFKDYGGELFGSFGGVAFDPELGSLSFRWRTLLTMPGQLLKTNGVPMRDGRILWLHLASDLALRSTRREAESIVIDRNAISSLGGDAANLAPEELLELLTSLGRGRDRRPVEEKIQLLQKIIRGDEDRNVLLRRDEYASLVRILKIKEIPK